MTRMKAAQCISRARTQLQTTKLSVQDQQSYNKSITNLDKSITNLRFVCVRCMVSQGCKVSQPLACHAGGQVAADEDKSDAPSQLNNSSRLVTKVLFSTKSKQCQFPVMQAANLPMIRDEDCTTSAAAGVCFHSTRLPVRDQRSILTPHSTGGQIANRENGGMLQCPITAGLVAGLVLQEQT